VSTGARSPIAAAWARPTTRATRGALVVLGAALVAIRLVPRGFDDDALHGVIALGLVGASLGLLAAVARRTWTPLRRALPPELVAPTVGISIATTVLGGLLLGAPILAALERRYGQLWAAGLLLLLALATARRQVRHLPGLDRAAASAEAAAAATSAESAPANGRRKKAAAPPLLEVREVDFGYGKLQVLHGVDLTVGEGELVALLGVNGAGKSTLLRAISGLGTPTAGTIRFAGEDITYLDAERRVRLGISQVPGGRAVFGNLTVADNLRSYAYSLDRKQVDAAMDRALATFPRLEERRNQAAGTLSGGEQQMLALAKASMLRPRLLLIDELSLGLAPIIVGQLLDMVRQINADGTAVVLVEQSVNIALNLAQHAYFMERGAVKFDGRSKDLLARDDLLRAVFLEGAAAR
jgi:ABC-type branched-subunit amino acid transport system ATPase component